MRSTKLLSIALVTVVALTVVSGAGVLTAQAAQTDPTSDEIAEALDCLTLGNDQNPPWVWEQSHSSKSEVQTWQQPSMEGGSLLLLQPLKYGDAPDTSETLVKVSNVAGGAFVFDAYAGTQTPLKLFVDDVFVQEFSTNTPNIQVVLDSTKLHSIKWTAESSTSWNMGGAGLDDVFYISAAAKYVPTVTATVTQNGVAVDTTHPAVTGQEITVTSTCTQGADASTTELARNIIVWDGTKQVAISESVHPVLTEANPTHTQTFTFTLQNAQTFDIYIWTAYSAWGPGYPYDDFIGSDGFGTDYYVAVKAPQDAASDTAGALKTTTVDTTFLNPSTHKAFDSKLTEVINYINAGDYATALTKVQRDLLPKADGKASPPDWVSATEQPEVYAQLKTIESDLILLLS